MKFGQNCEIKKTEIWSKFWVSVKNSEIWSKFRNLVKIRKFGMVWYEYVWFGHNFEAECWKRLCNPQPLMNDKGGHRAARAAKNWKCKYCLVCNLLEIPFCRRDWPSSVFAITINQIPLLAYFHLLFPNLFFLFNLPRSFFFFSWQQNLHHTLWAESFWPISWST